MAYMARPITRLSDEQIAECFRSARVKVMEIRKRYNVDCCTDVALVNYQNSKTPVQVWYNTQYEQFCASFSNKYRNNPEKKVQTYFERIILSTNTDGSFKSRVELATLASKLAKADKTLNAHAYKTTTMSSYLNCDETFTPNAYCNKCHDKVEIAMEDVGKVSCPCGGQFVLMSSESKKALLNQYTQKVVKHGGGRKGTTIDKNKFTEDFFKNLNVSQEAINQFNNDMAEHETMNIRLYRDKVKNACEDRNIDLAKIYKHAFPDFFKKCETAIGKGRLAVINGEVVNIQRNQFDGTEEDYNTLTDYIFGGISVNRMKKFVKEAVETSKFNLVKSLLKVDKSNFLSALPHIGKKVRQKMEENGVNVNDLGNSES